MSLPFFFVPELQGSRITLDEDTSKHMIGVLRMMRGEEVLLTDGRGARARARIADDNRKRCTLEVEEQTRTEASQRKIAIAISLTKNAARFEWFLEKATELGITEIIPLVCARTEKEKFRSDRMQGILVSAMLQSQQTWLPQLRSPTPFDGLITETGYRLRFIAHCSDSHRDELTHHLPLSDSGLMLIGPEGDFTDSEIRAALEKGFVPVSLGSTRLRTETAGMTAAVLMSRL